jgi:hypothetical protein
MTFHQSYIRCAAEDIGVIENSIAYLFRKLVAFSERNSKSEEPPDHPWRRDHVAQVDFFDNRMIHVG